MRGLRRVWRRVSLGVLVSMLQIPLVRMDVWLTILPPWTDIKKAITCLLMGGSKKILPDGMRLRGDINVLLLGDPGTAKSQLLKFVEKVSPISVYTSGKGSSAAGLTASVQRDPNTVSRPADQGYPKSAEQSPSCLSENSSSKAEPWFSPTVV